uniref:Uncharacterized protein n=1 Tax=Candidatus Kentrum sp. TC TaxID=2126339 RepID=A0A450YZX4_9GAMM|nr:MAG: hypothetical protein BECKTC1821E_GA0114239_101522 [Candidatus Kentron sp. TC]VFK47048.1 MAG: hypothetical protein BECKTC1821D_GA0114238_10405 [Candidatus Kentron sp. TC]VFK57492.1 MAG: hypothetical protein BECKTC1821F_GA0114240_101813 [Candidatus Kentron sp. TC]
MIMNYRLQSQPEFVTSIASEIGFGSIRLHFHLLSPHLINRIAHMCHDVKSAQNMSGILRFLGKNFQVWFYISLRISRKLFGSILSDPQ